MKLKGLLIALVVGPIVGFILSQVMWRVYDFAGLAAFLDVGNFSDLTLAVFGLSWLGIAYKGLKSKQVNGKKHVAKKRKQLDLDKDITIKDVSETFRPSKKNALLEFIIIGSGKNLHQVMPYKQDAEYKCGEQTFKVENDNLLIRKPLFGKIKLTAIFHADGKAVKIAGSNDKKVTAEILSLAQRSGALGRTIKEMFSTHLDLKKILFFVVIGVVAVVVFLVLSGGIL